MKKLYLSRKESIVITAIEILDELGIQGLTIREIASRECVSEAAIYRHYRSKEDILHSVLDQFSIFDKKIFNTIKSENMNIKDGLRFFANSYAEYYENYPEITAIIFSYNAFTNEVLVGERMKKIIEDRFQFIKYLIELGKSTGEIDKNVKGDEIAFLICGIFKSVTERWRMLGNDFNLKEKLLSLSENIIKNNIY